MTDTETDDVPERDPRRKAIRELKWLANSFKGVMALVDDLDAHCDLTKELEAERRDLEARVAELRKAKAQLGDVDKRLASKKAELADIESRIKHIKETL